MAEPAATAADTERPFLVLVRDRRFRLLWMSQFVSGVGDWLVIGFLIPLVTNLSNGSASAVAGIWVAKIVPSLLFTGVVGALVDRFDRRRLMIACDLVRAGLALLLFTNNLAVIYLVVMAMETASLFFNPARNAFIPALVEERHVAAANGLAYTTQQMSMLIGLTASGAILAGFEAIVRRILNSGLPLVSRLVGPFAPELLGPRAGIVLDSLTFLFSATCIFLIFARCAPQHEGALSFRMIGADVVESFRFLRTHRELRGFITAVSLAILGGGGVVALGPVFVAENLSGRIPFIELLPALEKLFASPMVFMLVFAAGGMVAGGLLVNRLEHRVRLQTMFVGSIAGFGACMIAFALTDRYWLAAVFAVGCGFALAMLTVSGNTYIMRSTSDRIRGRVFTAMDAVIRLSVLASMLAVAPLADLAGGIVERFARTHGIAPANVTFTGTRIALLLAAVPVLTAAAYALFVVRSPHEILAGAADDGAEEVAADV